MSQSYEINSISTSINSGEVNYPNEVHARVLIGDDRELEHTFVKKITRVYDLIVCCCFFGVFFLMDDGLLMLSVG